jgi:DnaK suppressor protein
MDERVLDQSQRDELRRFMSDELISLKGEIANLEILTRPVSPDNAIGRLSRLEAMNEKSVNEVALRSARERVTRISIALGRVDDDEFGLCAECAVSIPFARLKSMLGSRLCVKCTELAGG